MRRALPVSGVCSKRASSGCPWGVWRTKRVAASKGPRAGGVAAVLACRAQACAARCLATLAKAARRRARLDAWAPLALVDCVAPPEAEDVAHAGKRVEQRPGVGLGVRGGCAAREGQGLAPCGIRGEEGQSDRQGFVPGGSITALGPPLAVGCGGDLCADLGEVVVALGIVPGGATRRAVAPQGGTASEHGTGGTPLGRRDSGLGAHAAAQEGGTLLGSDRLVLRRAAMEGCHRRACPRPTGRPCAVPRAASQYQGQRHSTAPPKPSREGATAVRTGAGAAGLLRWSRIAPS